MPFKRTLQVFGLAALLAATPAVAQWTVNGDTISTGQTKVVYGASSVAAKIQSNPDSVSMAISNRTAGNLVFDYGLALVVREGNGGGTIRAYMNSDGFLGLGTSSPQTELDVRGTITTEVLEITGGSDVAELFDVHGGAEPGTVVSIDTERPGALRVSSAAYDRTVLGVVSGAGGVSSGLLLGQPGTLAYGSHAVAVSGRVYVKADATNGPIAPGDLLTTSSRTGHVMKATEDGRMVGAIVGKALSPLTDDSGLVLAVIALQ